MGYDTRGYLTTMIDSGSSGAISTIIDTWDAAGRKTNQSRDGVLATYTMDSDDRLTGENRGGNLSTFGYDNDRNMTLLHNHGQNAVTMSHNGFGQVVTSIAGSVVTTNTWDNAGRKTVANVGGTLTTFGWDQENRMVSRVVGAGSLNFVYDEANHLRYQFNPASEEGGLSYNYLDDNTFTVYSELFGTRSEQMTPLQGVNVGNDDMDFLLDPLGSVVGKSSSGGVEDLSYFFPYGDLASGARPVSDLWAYVGSLGYRRSDDTLYDVWNRWLETNAGHWKSADALWPDELAYVYVAGIPHMAVDWTGLLVATSSCPVGCGRTISRPGWLVTCTPAWNRYIFEFCNCLRCRFQNGSVAGIEAPAYMRDECDTLARQYYYACRKGIPGPGRFAPPPGSRGVVAPRRSGPIPQFAEPSRSRPCIAPSGKSGSDCVDEASHVDLFFFSHWQCLHCCQINRDVGQFERFEECNRLCNVAYAMFLMAYANQFGPGPTGSYGAYPIPRGQVQVRR